MSVETLITPETGELGQPTTKDFVFYVDAAELLLRGKEWIEKAKANPDILGHQDIRGLALMNFFASSERAVEKFLDLFVPVSQTHSTTKLSYDLTELSINRNLVLEEPPDLKNYMDYRNNFAHGREVIISQEDIEKFSKTAEEFLSYLKRETWRNWEQLVIQKNLGFREWNEKRTRERRGIIRSAIWLDLWENSDEWVDTSFGDEVSWFLYDFSDFKPEDFKPKLPTSVFDFVVSFQDGATPDNPAEIQLFSKTLIGEDLYRIFPDTFEPFIGHEFIFLLFIPEQLKEEFIERLKAIKNRVKFITYHYDQDGQIHLNYDMVKR